MSADALRSFLERICVLDRARPFEGSEFRLAGDAVGGGAASGVAGTAKRHPA